jgi:hypothetical protein
MNYSTRHSKPPGFTTKIQNAKAFERKRQQLLQKVPRRAYFLNFNATLRSTWTEMLIMRYFNPTRKFYCRHELEFSTHQTYSGVNLKASNRKISFFRVARYIFFLLGPKNSFTITFKKPTMWPPIWTFTIRLRLFIYRCEGPILLHFIKIYFIVHRTALRFSQSDTRNLTFRLIEVWMS